ncbi:MAG: IS1595 family transposase [Terracidiphilus sp.]
MNLNSIARQFSDSEDARAFLESQRWPDGVVCPFCGLVGEAYRLKAKQTSKKPVRPGVWKCAGCRKQFTVTVGTIFEDSHIPLNTWLMAIHLLCSSKKGMSAHQLHRMLGITYKSAWFMAHRLRYALTHGSIFPKLSGTVEIDETYIGGKMRAGSQAPKQGKRTKDRHCHIDNKAPVVALVQRDGRVRSVHMPRVTADNLRAVVRQTLMPDVRVMTDTSTVAKGALLGREHYQVNHKREEYVRYENGLMITTNTVEGFFGLLKRGINGIYHHVGQQHLHRYLCEFDFRYNTRKVTDGERSVALIKRVGGKRLMYKQVKPSE